MVRKRKKEKEKGENDFVVVVVVVVRACFLACSSSSILIHAATKKISFSQFRNIEKAKRIKPYL